MEVKEMREALEEHCDSFDFGCTGCAIQRSGYTGCDFDNAPDEMIYKWYAMAFPEPVIKDSGNRRTFESGAVRDMGDNEEKGRCDLLPLEVLSVHLGNQTLHDIEQFKECGDTDFLYDVLRRTIIEFGYGSLATMYLELAKHFAEGAKKYGIDNWKKGIPVWCYVDSAVRHYLKWLRGDKDEPHDRAFCWNIVCAIWTCYNLPELNDYAKGDNDVS